MPVAYVHLMLSFRARLIDVLPAFRSYNQYPPTYAVTDDVDRNKQNDIRVDVRTLTRTPSPTPSEVEALSPGKKKRGGFIRSIFNPETYKDRKEFGVYASRHLCVPTNRPSVQSESSSQAPSSPSSYSSSSTSRIL